MLVPQLHCSASSGVDFYYQTRGHALKFIDFLQSVVPARFRHDKQLVSHDTHNMTYNYKYTFSVEIVPLCKVRATSDSIATSYCVRTWCAPC